MRRPIALLACAFTLAAACSGGGDEVDVDDGGEDGAAEAGGDLRGRHLAPQPDQLDPHQTTAYASFQVLENVYDTLVVPDPDNLASSSRRSPATGRPARTASPGPSRCATT